MLTQSGRGGGGEGGGRGEEEEKEQQEEEEEEEEEEEKEEEKEEGVGVEVGVEVRVEIRRGGGGGYSSSVECSFPVTPLPDVLEAKRHVVRRSRRQNRLHEQVHEPREGVLVHRLDLRQVRIVGTVLYLQ